MNIAPHITRIGAGTTRGWHAFWDDIEPKERAARLTAATAVCWVVGGVAYAERRALWVLLAAWCLTAWVAGRPDTDDEQDNDEAAEQQPGPDPADMADIVRELGQGTGVLLTALRDQLLEEYPGQGWTTKRARPLLAEAGIRVREGVRVTGAGNGPGVHRDDIPAPLPATTPPPPVGVVAAGQNTNTNTNNVTVVEHANGAQITLTPIK